MGRLADDYVRTLRFFMRAEEVSQGHFDAGKSCAVVSEHLW